ncbi:MAG TPA: hypothetical protein EYQ88_04090 [Candidatus Thioglobus sp.]|nr:hypothetical protein [Candidatus Thioglobus sp.]
MKFVGVIEVVWYKALATSLGLSNNISAGIISKGVSTTNAITSLKLIDFIQPIPNFFIIADSTGIECITPRNRPSTVQS